MPPLIFVCWASALRAQDDARAFPEQQGIEEPGDVRFLAALIADDDAS